MKDIIIEFFNGFKGKKIRPKVLNFEQEKFSQIRIVTEKGVMIIEFTEQQETIDSNGIHVYVSVNNNEKDYAKYRERTAYRGFLFSSPYENTTQFTLLKSNQEEEETLYEEDVPPADDDDD